MEPPGESRPPPLDPVVSALAERLGVGLADARVALAAVTHKSYVNEHRGEGLQDNERLEFLGDAVIDLAVSHRLMERFPEAREGDLSKIRASLVDESALARIARDLDLGGLLRLGRGEELTGGRQKSSLLADAMEAVIAALYLEGGLLPVLTLVDRFLGEAFERAAAGTLDRDYKTQFQELAQSRMRSAPRYRVVAEHGPDHSKVFEVELELRGEVVGRGSGRSKKDAEQAAAKTGLDALQGRNDQSGPLPTPLEVRAAAVNEPQVVPSAAPPPAPDARAEEAAPAEAPAAEPATDAPKVKAAPAEPAPARAKTPRTRKAAVKPPAKAPARRHTARATGAAKAAAGARERTRKAGRAAPRRTRKPAKK